MTDGVVALIYSEGGKERRVDLKWDGEIDMPPIDQLKGLLKGIRYILGTQEGDSILAQAVTVHRRYTQAWPDFQRLNVLSQMIGAQICKVHPGWGEVIWWNQADKLVPDLRDSLDKAIKRYEDEDDRPAPFTAQYLDEPAARGLREGQIVSTSDTLAKRPRETSEAEIRPERRTD